MWVALVVGDVTTDHISWTWSRSMGSSVMFMIALILLAASAVGKRWRRARIAIEVEIIDVASSPEPTCRAVTPKTHASTPERRARRASAKRIRSHRRTVVRLLDPKGNGDCGYECMLACAGYTQTKKRITRLRTMTSLAIGRAWESTRDTDKRGGWPHGHGEREVLEGSVRKAVGITV